jgi:hypothetical protein
MSRALQTDRARRLQRGSTRHGSSANAVFGRAVRLLDVAHGDAPGRYRVADERPTVSVSRRHTESDLLGPMTKRLLVAAGDSARSIDEIPFGVRELIDGADEILVVTPALPSRFEWLASATDRAREQADERLRAVLGQIAELGGEAEGTVGADDPLLAFEDAIRDFDPDHLLIALRAGEDAGWQETGLLDQLQQRFGLPVTAFAVASD